MSSFGFGPNRLPAVHHTGGELIITAEVRMHKPFRYVPLQSINGAGSVMVTFERGIPASLRFTLENKFPIPKLTIHDPGGAVVTLHNAIVAGIAEGGEGAGSLKHKHYELTVVEFTFQKIELSHKGSKTGMTDDWNAPG